MLEQIKKYLYSYLQRKNFVFRFELFARDIVVNDTNVVEYEFVNLGDNVVDINGAPLQPAGSNFDRMKLDIRHHEQDTTIYRIKFADTNGVCTATFLSSLCGCALQTDDAQTLLTDEGIKMCTDQ